MVAMGSKGSEVHAKFNISSSTLGEWIKDKANIAAKINGGKTQVKRLTPVQFPKTEADSMTSLIFEDYLRRWDRKLTREKRRIALILDNATLLITSLKLGVHAQLSL